MSNQDDDLVRKLDVFKKDDLRISDVFNFYFQFIKPLYVEVESKNNTIPVELLFETQAAFDHLSRIYAQNEDEHSSCSKALSHLKRASFDAFKLKLEYFNDETGRIQKMKVDFESIDNGNYLPSYIGSKNEILNKAKSARLAEGVDHHHAFSLWIDVSAMINKFFVDFINRDEINWARRRKIAGFLLKLITGFIIALIIELLLNDAITQVIGKIFIK